MGYLWKGVVVCLDRGSPGSAQTARKLDVLLLDGNALGMDSTQICVVEQIDQEGLGRLLEGSEGLTLPSGGTIVGGDQLGNFAHLEESQLGGYKACVIDVQGAGRVS